MGLDDTIQFKMAIQQKFHFCDFRWPHPTTWDLNGYLNVARRSPAKDWGLGQDVRPGYSMISLKYRYWCILMYIDVYWCILMYIDVQYICTLISWLILIPSKLLLHCGFDAYGCYMMSYYHPPCHPYDPSRKANCFSFLLDESIINRSHRKVYIYIHLKTSGDIQIPRSSLKYPLR